MSHSNPDVGLRMAPHLAVVSMGYIMFSYAGVPSYFLGKYGIEYAAFGLLLSVTLFPFVLVQWPTSRLVERTTTTRLLLAATVAHAGIGLTLDFAPTFATLLGLRFIWGIAGGTVLSVGATHVARLNSAETASRQQGIYGGMLTLGGAIGFLVAPRFASMTAGVGIHALGTLIAVPAVIVLWRRRTDRLTRPSAKARDTSPMSVVTHPTVILASLCYVAAIGSYLTLSTFITAYFEGLGVVGPLNAFVLVVATVGRAAGGSAVVRLPLSDIEMIGGASMVAVTGFGVLAIEPAGPLLLALPFVVMLAVSLPFGAVYNVAAGATDAEGTALTMVIAVGNLVALTLPVVTGTIRDVTGGYEGAFVLLVGLNGLAIGATVILSWIQR